MSGVIKFIKIVPLSDWCDQVYKLYTHHCNTIYSQSEILSWYNLSVSLALYQSTWKYFKHDCKQTSKSDVDLFWLYVDRGVPPWQCPSAEEEKNPKFRFHRRTWLMCRTGTENVCDLTGVVNLLFPWDNSTEREESTRRCRRKGLFKKQIKEVLLKVIICFKTLNRTSQFWSHNYGKIRTRFPLKTNKQHRTYSHLDQNTAAFLPHKRSVFTPRLVGSQDPRTCVTARSYLLDYSRLLHNRSSYIR